MSLKKGSLPPEIAAEMQSDPIVAGLTEFVFEVCTNTSTPPEMQLSWPAISEEVATVNKHATLSPTFVVLLPGLLYRESGVVSGIVNQRWGAVFPHSIATFKSQESKQASKVWPLSPRCQLSKIKDKEFMVREKHTSTIWALAAGHCERKQLVRPSSPIGGIAVWRSCCSYAPHPIPHCILQDVAGRVNIPCL